MKSDSDEIILRSSDMDFPVTTHSANVREFFAAGFDGVKLVFSINQSAHIVATMKRGNAFGLAIFDEAHKITGREGDFGCFHVRRPASDAKICRYVIPLPGLKEKMTRM